ncbi:hypothetical protein EZ428_07280 [Pedobacter frigiditerrae]|uniref:Uncharacterized protein n=1 Tax=Pedobacter frigiditerrae TaxID=2530452 RepID=A0A4R0MWE1_9SPHI|nr:hypothetical protein [Pedobacter frigiditerrae]TCC91559.1 hypothetical protein EZ428_07280 [Pedobacter frigiditerrae]
MFNEILIYVFAATLAVIQLVYVVYNIVRQRQVEKKLETILMKNQEQLYNKLNHLPELTKAWKPENAHSLESYEEAYLLYFLKNKIETLEKDERRMMTKIFERKSNSDQMRYAFKLFSEAGLANLFDNYKNRKLVAK